MRLAPLRDRWGRKDSRRALLQSHLDRLRRLKEDEKKSSSSSPVERSSLQKAVPRSMGPLPDFNVTNQAQANLLPPVVVGNLKVHTIFDMTVVLHTLVEVKGTLTITNNAASAMDATVRFPRLTSIGCDLLIGHFIFAPVGPNVANNGNALCDRRATRCAERSTSDNFPVLGRNDRELGLHNLDCVDNSINRHVRTRVDDRVPQVGDPLPDARNANSRRSHVDAAPATAKVKRHADEVDRTHGYIIGERRVAGGKPGPSLLESARIRYPLRFMLQPPEIVYPSRRT